MTGHRPRFESITLSLRVSHQCVVEYLNLLITSPSPWFIFSFWLLLKQSLQNHWRINKKRALAERILNEYDNNRIVMNIYIALFFEVTAIEFVIKPPSPRIQKAKDVFSQNWKLKIVRWTIFLFVCFSHIDRWPRGFRQFGAGRLSNA